MHNNCAARLDLSPRLAYSIIETLLSDSGSFRPDIRCWKGGPL